MQKLREKKLISEDGTLEIVTKITREQTSRNVSFNIHAREQDAEGLAGQVWKAQDQRNFEHNQAMKLGTKSEN